MKRLAAAGAALVLTGLLTACGGDSDSDPVYHDDPKSLNIVAGSEQRTVLETIVRPWCDDHGYSCTFTLKGSVDQARLLSGGERAYDVYWFASTVFLQLGDTTSTLQDVQPLFLTPLVYAGWRSEMERLGFVDRPDLGIGEILQAVESGDTSVWVTNPTQSNSGATALFGFMNYFAGNGAGQALSREQLDSATVDDGITRFIRSMDQTFPSTGTMMDECVARPGECRTLFTYEDLVIEKNQELAREGKEQLYAAYPKGALAISDAPMGFFPHGAESDAGKRQAMNELQDYLLSSADGQAKLLAIGRRPATSIGLSLNNPDLAVFNPDWGIQANLREQGIAYPAGAVIEEALARYQTHYRLPVASFYCLDGSGSMHDNGGWDGVEAAAHQVFDQDQAAVNFLQANPNDITTVAIFNSGLVAGPWTVAGNDPTALHGLTQNIVDYNANGGTNMYSCLSQAATDLAQAPTDRKRLVILMTDGVSDSGKRDQALSQLAAAGIPVVAIAFGSEIDENQLREVAQATGGSYFAQNDLVAALRQASGYK